MAPCANCNAARAVIVRPKNKSRLCKTCFITIFEDEVHETIISTSLFHRGERVAIGASGGKDSTVLASIMGTLNKRHDYGLDLVLLSIDEGIKGYRDDSLETVKRNAVQYKMPLKILGYGELYGWTMDEVVAQIGKKGNCTYCGVFRRQALDRGAAMLGVQHVVTGHNADDMAETVMMNLLRGDIPRLARSTSIVTSASSPIPPSSSSTTASSEPSTGTSITSIKRSKPLKYAYEKEIVLYAHHKSLDYFTTECIYSPEAFRGSARTLIKNLERIRPSAILDIIRSGEELARLVPNNEGADGGVAVVKAGEKVRAGGDGDEGGTGKTQRKGRCGGSDGEVCSSQKSGDGTQKDKKCCKPDDSSSGKDISDVQKIGVSGVYHIPLGEDDGSLGCGDAMVNTIATDPESDIRDSNDAVATTTVGTTNDLETEITIDSLNLGKAAIPASTLLPSSTAQTPISPSPLPPQQFPQSHPDPNDQQTQSTTAPTSSSSSSSSSHKPKTAKARAGKANSDPTSTTNPPGGTSSSKQVNSQTIRQCARCGYMSSQLICQACALIESLNKARATRMVAVTSD